VRVIALDQTILGRGKMYYGERKMVRKWFIEEQHLNPILELLV
jgi:hypothetical protein